MKNNSGSFVFSKDSPCESVGEGLTRQLLAFSRRQTMRPDRTDLNTLTADLMEMLRRLIPEHIEIEFRPDPDLGNLRARPALDHQL